MNIDIRLSTDFFLHPKTKLLQKQLGPKGVLCLQKLWIWAAQNRPNGVLGVQSYDYIAMAADWTGKSQLFVDTLLELHWLDCDENGSFSLHNWERRQPYAKDANERRARAQQQSQEKAAEISDKRREAANRRWDKQRSQERDDLPTVNNVNDLGCKPDANVMQTTCKCTMQTDANENLHDANAMQKNANGCYQTITITKYQNLDHTPLISPQGETPDADAPAGVSAQAQEAKHAAQEQPAPSPQPEAQPEQPTLSPEQPAKQKRKKGRKDRRDELPVRPQDFDRWYHKLYPRHEARQDAVCAWNDADEAGVLPEMSVLEKALEWQIPANDWNPRTRRNYIPLPATYLNARRWQDEPPNFASQSFQQGQSYRPQYSTNNGGMDKFEAQRLCGQQIIEEMVKQGLVTDTPKENAGDAIDAELVSPFQLPQAHMQGA